MNADQRGIDAVLAALADPTRRQLLDVLAQQGLASATTLAGRLPVSRQAVVKHLRVLEGAGLVAGARSGREVLYRVRPQRLDASARWLADLAAAWDRRLTALKRAAEAPQATGGGPAGRTARDRTEGGPAGPAPGRGGPR
jgi:DNA-binding transcriptional ArsR family regulator